jgi:IS4 transposase
MQNAVREVAVMTETAIELLFRLMKQMLKITCFLGRSENPVRIQIAATMQMPSRRSISAWFQP